MSMALKEWGWWRGSVGNHFPTTPPPSGTSLIPPLKDHHKAVETWPPRLQSGERKETEAVHDNRGVPLTAPTALHKHGDLV